MKKLFCGVVMGLGLVIAGQPNASAATFTSPFSFSGPADSGSGVFTLEASGAPGVDTIVGISGTVNGFAISALLAPGTYPPKYPPENDNLFYEGAGPFLDDAGVSFALADGTNVNFWYTAASGTPAYWLFEGPNQELRTLSTAVGTTPEPGSLMLLGTGMVGVLGMARRRFLA